MKIKLAIFIITIICYYLLATGGKFVIPYDVDYFSPLAKSFLSGRLDIPNPILKSELSIFNGKWYPYWGPLPALLLMPGQFILGRYFPPAYLAILFAGLNTVVVFAILKRLKELYLGANLKPVNIFVFLIFFALGTSHLFVATRSGTWYVAQAVSFLPSALALFILIKNKLTPKDYLVASTLIAVSLIGRYNLILVLVLLALRFFDDAVITREKFKILRQKIIFSAFPVVLFFTIFAIYNYVRFGNIFDFGFTYTLFDYFDFSKAAPHGFYSLAYIPRNLGYMLLEIPKLTFSQNGHAFFDWNRYGMSIFVVSPVFLAAFLTLRRKLFSLPKFINRLTIYLWVLVIIQIFLLAPFYTLGFLQVGIRYATDFSVALLILAVLGLEGKINTLVIFGVIIAVILNIFSLSGGVNVL